MLKWFASKKGKASSGKRGSQIDIEKLVDETNDIPTLPDIVFKVTEVINDPKSTAGDLEKTLAHDQAIVTKILKLVNSAYYRRREKIATLGKAIPILGFQNIRNLVFSMSLLEFSNDEIDMRSFWRHSFATSLIATQISVGCKAAEPEATGCAALIHDLGKVILYQHFPGEFIHIATKVCNGESSFFEAENEVFGINHAQIGKVLGDRWGFPEELTEPIEFHHSPELHEEDSDLVNIVYLANIISEKYGYGFMVDATSSRTELDKTLADKYLTGEELRNKVEIKLRREMPIFETFVDKMAAFRQNIEEHDKTQYEPSDVWT